MPKVFVSYSHRQGDWVWNQLVPCLKAGGAEVLIDRERFVAGEAVFKQMDALQDQADRHVLILSDDYLKSKACRHEMDRAIALDPDFSQRIVIPVKVDACSLPVKITRPNPLYVDLSDDKQPAPWDLLLKQCGADLGATAPAWLEARDEVVRLLQRGQSVNLVVNGNVKWRALLDHVARDCIPDLALVNLENPATVPRHGLIAEIARVFGSPRPIPPDDDLPEFGRILSARPVSRLALIHFDLAPYRKSYDVNLFSSLRFLVMEERKLILLVQSREQFDVLIPKDHPLSEIEIRRVELKRRA